MADRRTTIRFEFLADIQNAVRGWRQIGNVAKTEADSVAKSAKKVEEATAKATRGGVRGTASSGIRNIAEAGLHGSVTPLASIQSAALAQFGGAEKVLERFSTKTLAAGAGLTAAGFAAGKFGQAAVRNFRSATAAVDSFQDVTGASAEEASKMVAVAEHLGVSSDSLAGAMFKLARNTSASQGELRKFGVEIARNDDGSVDLVETLANVADAHSRMTDATDRAALVQAAFGRGGAEMIDVLEQQGAGLRELAETAAARAPMLTQEEIDLGIKFERTLNDLDQAWKRLTVEAGPGLVRVLDQAAQLATDVVSAFERLPLHDKALIDIKGPSGIDAVRWLHSLGQESGGASTAMGSAATAAQRFGFSLAGMSGWVQRAAAATREAAASAATFSSAVVGVGVGIGRQLGGLANKRLTAIADSTRNYQAALQALDNAQGQAADASQTYARTVESAAESIAAAEQSVNDAHRSAAQAAVDYAKVQTDAAEAVAEAVADYAKTQRDAAESVADAEEAASRRIIDAEERLMEVRERAARQQRDSAERLQDARQAAADAMSDALKEENPFEAQRRREEAIRDLQRAERDHAETVSDSQEDVADAEKDTAQARVDAAESVRDAHEQAAEQIAAAEKRISDAHEQAAEAIASAGQRVQDAQRGVSDASDGLSRAMRDAERAQYDAAQAAQRVGQDSTATAGLMQGLVDATRDEAQNMRDLGYSQDEIKPKIDAAKQKIYETAAALGWTRQQAADYIRQLNFIPREIITQVNFTVGGLVGRSVTDAARGLGAQVAQLAQQQILYRDSGGPLPPGLSMVYNGTGRDEWVVNPAETPMGGGTTVIVQGSVISERELMDIIARAARRGYRG